MADAQSSLGELIMAQGLRARAWDQAEELALEIARRINLLGAEAHKQGKYLAVGPFDCHHESRPTDFGHYVKFKLNYTLYDEVPTQLQHDWVLYDTVGASPCELK